MLTFEVKDMTCGHCVSAITKALKEVDPQAQVQVDLAGKKVEVESSQAREAIAKAIADEGYAVTA